MHRTPQNDNINPLESVRTNDSLLDLIPLPELQQLQDLLAQIHNVASVITDADGNLLTLPSNEIAFCRLVRKYAQGFARCMDVSRSMTAANDSHVHTACRPCESLGILRAAVPIRIDDRHLADWWISQYCAHTLPMEQLKIQKGQIGIDIDMLLNKLNQLPKGDKKSFNKILSWIDDLIHRLAGLAHHNQKLTHSLSSARQLREKMGKHHSGMEARIQERTTELIKANNRLQLEVLERDLAEEQIERKSKLLDAINHILQQTLTDQSDQTLTDTFLECARKLTSSPFGFIAEQREGRWHIAALHHPNQDMDAITPHQPRDYEISQIWRRLGEEGNPLIIRHESRELSWRPLPKSHPELKSLMAVVLSKGQQISGFVALADNQEGYALIDQFDVEVLTQAFIEALLRKRMEKAKSISEKRLNLALESANEGLWDYAPISGQIYYSPRWFAMLGYMTGEFPDTMETWNALTHPEDLPILEGTFNALANLEKDAFSIEVRMLSQTGQWLWLQARGRTVEYNEKGQVQRIVGTLIDINKYKQVEAALQKANEELQRLAALDDLTQIANRRRFEDRLGQEWRRAQRETTNLAVIMCDIDHFKNYNDTYGHLQGDQALYTVAQSIYGALKRPMDMVARYGGEEFAIILPGTGINGAERVTREVREAIETLHLEHKSSGITGHITLSFGVAAMVPRTGLSAKILIEAADKALYRAKARGRNRIICVSTG